MGRKERRSQNQNFELLPYEIFYHILSFLTLELNIIPSKKRQLVMARFQSVSKKINELKEMQVFFNDFWWRVYETHLGNGVRREELEKLKSEMIERGELRRKVILALYCANLQRLAMKKQKYNSDEIKILVCGQQGVGKSTLTIKFITGMFVDVYDPTIEDSYRKQISLDDKPYLLDILDTVEHDHFGLTISYYRSAQCFIVVCDVTDPASIEFIHTKIKLMSSIKFKNTITTPIQFVINKIDLLSDSERIEKIDQARKAIQKVIDEFSLLNVGIVEISCKYENISRVFEEIARRTRNCFIDGFLILQNVVMKDADYIKELKGSQKCSLM